jgi:hypothetical protein
MPMRIIGGYSHEYERVTVGKWIAGVIDEVQYAANRKCRVYDRETDAWVEGMQNQLRLALRLDGYEHRHYSRWMRSSTHPKATFYRKFLKPLCPNHDCAGKPIDVDRLKGVRVKTRWEQRGDYENLVEIHPLDPNLNIIADKRKAASKTDKADEEPSFDNEESGEEGPF